MSANDDYTVLNPGEGGDAMDETGLTFPSEPTIRKRPRVVITGDGGINEIARVQNTAAEVNDYGLLIRIIPPSGGSTYFNEVSLVSASTETTITSLVVPVGKRLYLTGFNASGDLYGKWILYVNGTIRFTMRTTAQALNTTLSLTQIAIHVQQGESVQLKVIHEQTGFQGNFEATLLGHIVDTLIGPIGPT